MNRKRNSLLIVIITLSSLTVTGCNSVSVRHDHGHNYGHAYGPPPHAPAHGYRHHYHGHDLVYDTYLGVYLVLGLANHYYHGGHFYRYDNHRHFWYHRKGSDKHWSRYNHVKKLPSGIAKKHIHHGNKPNQHKKHVKKNNVVPGYVKHNPDRQPHKSNNNPDREYQYRGNDHKVNGDNRKDDNNRDNQVRRNTNKQRHVDTVNKRDRQEKPEQAYNKENESDNDGKHKRQDRKKDGFNRNLKSNKNNKRQGRFLQKG